MSYLLDVLSGARENLQQHGSNLAVVAGLLAELLVGVAVPE